MSSSSTSRDIALSPLAKRLLVRWIRHRPKNVNCPLTQDKLERPIFRYITEDEHHHNEFGGHVHGYCLEPLIQWIKTQGKPIDPVTKHEYNTIELKRMDREAKQHNMEQNPSLYEICTDTKIQRLYEIKRDLEALESLTEEEKVEIAATEVQHDLNRLQALYEVNDQRLFGHAMDYCDIAGRDILILAEIDIKRCLAEINEFNTWLITTRCKAPSPLRHGIQGFMSAIEHAMIAMDEKKEEIKGDDILEVALASVESFEHEEIERPAITRRRRRRRGEDLQDDESEEERPPSRRRRR